MVDDALFPESYRPPQIPFTERSPGDWDRPANYPIYKDREHFLATVHAFDAGGFEATIRCVDLQSLVDARMRPRGHRKPVGERDERDMLRSVARAKKTLRHAVKQIGCDLAMGSLFVQSSQDADYCETRDDVEKSGKRVTYMNSFAYSHNAVSRGIYHIVLPKRFVPLSINYFKCGDNISMVSARVVNDCAALTWIYVGNIQLQIEMESASDRDVSKKLRRGYL